jgi:hypothetical protein
MLSGLIAIAMEAFPATSLNDQSEKSAMILVFIAVWYTAWGLLNESFVGPLMPESVVFAAIIGVGAGIGSQRNLLRAAQRNDQRLVHRGNG